MAKMITIGNNVKLFKNETSRKLIRLLKDSGYMISADPRPNDDEYVFSISGFEEPYRSYKDRTVNDTATPEA